MPKARQIYEFGHFRLDAGERLLLREGQPVPLTPKIFDTLLLLVENSGHLVDKEEFMQQLWPDAFVEEGALAQNISALRKVLGDRTNGERFIATVPKRGYRFVMPVSPPTGPVPAATPNGGNGTVSAAASADELQNPAAAVGPAERLVALPRRRTALFVLPIVGIAACLIAYLFRPVFPSPKVVRIVQLASSTHMPANQNLVTEGSRIHFMDREADSWKLHQVSSNGGEVSSVPLPFPQMDIADISPNGTELLVREFSGGKMHRLWAFPVIGGSPRPLGIVAANAGWAPSADRIAYSTGSDVYVAQADGSQARKIASAPGNVEDLRWSPDGTRIRFVVEDAATPSTAIWEISAAGGDAHPLLPGWNNPPAEWSGNWTRDGKYYVFQSIRDGRSDIWAIRETGDALHKLSHRPEQLTAGPVDFYRPVPSADGKKLFLVGIEKAGELLRYEPAAKRFVPYLKSISADSLDFSRDAQWVAYVTYPEGTLWRCRADGSNPLQLTFAPLRVVAPRWSPDGKHIFFSGRPSLGASFDVYVVAASGGSPQRMLEYQRDVRDPDGSPDGTSLALGLAGPEGQSGLAVLNLATSRLSPIRGSEGLMVPRYSPDGKFLAALSSQTLGLMLFDFSTQRWRDLRVTGAQTPRWSRDGTYLYWHAYENGQSSIYRLRIPDLKRERVVATGFLVTGYPGPWAGLTPDDSPLVLRDLSRKAIYTIEWQVP